MATNNATNTSSPITVSQGGTGLSTLTANALQVGNGTGTVTQLSVGASGTLLNGSTGANPTWTSSPLVSVSGNPTLKIYGTNASVNNGGQILLANDCTTSNYGGAFIACNISGSDTSVAGYIVQQRTNANAFVAQVLYFNYSTQTWTFYNSNSAGLTIDSSGRQYNTRQPAFLA